MEIRKKITYQFSGIVALILLFTLVLVYISFSQARKEEFYDRLSNKAKLVAQMLIDIDEIDSELLKKIEINNPLNLANEKIIIFDYKDDVIYSNDEANLLKITEEKIHLVKVYNETRFKQNDYEIYGQSYIGQTERIVIFAAATDIFGINKLYRLRIILFISYILSLLIVYVAGRLFAIRALSPISKIINQVNKIEAANLNARLEEGSEKDEIVHLAKTFNNMLSRLEKAFQLQKNFIANASHELRTPLTVITGQMEVILMKSRTKDEYKKALSIALDEIKDLNSLSNKLLLLAQTNAERNELNFSNIRIDDILWKAQREILTRNENYSIGINFGEGIDDDSKLTVVGNELLLKTALLNLMDNACKYSDNHHVEINLDSNHTQIVIQFKDEGIGIRNEDINLIFQPFYRSKEASSSGHGIGLSLVENIINQHHGEIKVESEYGKGSVFTVNIPINTF